MLYPVCLTHDADGHVKLTAPDFDKLSARDADRQRALTRVHLKMEGVASQLLLDGAPLPTPSSVEDILNDDAWAGSEVLIIDINPVHLAAVARHQAGR